MIIIKIYNKKYSYNNHKRNKYNNKEVIKVTIIIMRCEPASLAIYL